MNFKITKRSILVLIILVGFLIYVPETQAADPYLNGFKCSTFASTGKKLMIFRMSNSEETTGSPEFDPTTGKFFCVEVSEEKTSANWLELVGGKDENGSLVINRDWNNKDVRAQYRDVCPNITGEWNTFGMDSDHHPSEGTYAFSFGIEHICDGGSPTYDARRRYYFNDLGSPIDEVFVFYIKKADIDEQQPNPIPLCAQKNGTDKAACEANNQCYWWGPKCLAKADTSIVCSELPMDICSSNVALHCKAGPNNTCVNKVTQVNMTQAVDQYIADRYSKPDGYDGPLPDCAFTGTCRSVEDLLGLGVKVADWLFSILAGLGFAFFVYGGVTMIFSFGNAEKVGQGKQILVAATIGIIIAFSAYVLVGFIVKAIGINPTLTPFN